MGLRVPFLGVGVLFVNLIVCCFCLFVFFGWDIFSGFIVFGFVGEFDPGSGRTLAACLTHASRTDCWVLASGG